MQTLKGLVLAEQFLGRGTWVRGASGAAARKHQTGRSQGTTGREWVEGDSLGGQKVRPEPMGLGRRGQTQERAAPTWALNATGWAGAAIALWDR